jgi:hypothetical protein
MHQWNDANDEQPRNQEADPDKHDRFDHGLPLLDQSLFFHNATGQDVQPA